MTESSPARDEEEIRNLIAGWCSAAEAGNVDAMAKFLAPDVLFLVAGQVLAGGEPHMSRERYLEGSQAMAAAVIMKIDNSIDELVVSGDLAVARQSFVINFMPIKGGKSTTYAGPSMLVFRRMANRAGEQHWLVWRDANFVAPKR